MMKKKKSSVHSYKFVHRPFEELLFFYDTHNNINSRNVIEKVFLARPPLLRIIKLSNPNLFRLKLKLSFSYSMARSLLSAV